MLERCGEDRLARLARERIDTHGGLGVQQAASVRRRAARKPEARPFLECSRDLALADVTTRVLTTGLAYYGLRDALLAARRKWLSSFESLRQDDAHRRHDGDAVRRAVCSAARADA